MNDMEFPVDITKDNDFRSYSPSSTKPQELNHNPSALNHYPSDILHDATAQPPNRGCLNFLSIEFYQPLFNVTHMDVLARVRTSMTPWKQDFFETIKSQPDLYGPFWILTTLIFLLSSAGNLSRYFNNLDKEEFLFRLQLLRYSVVIVYGFGFGFPMLLGLSFRFFSAPVTISQVICLYGYSLSCFIPILILCIIPTHILQWILMVYGMVNSTLFLLLNLRTELDSLSQPKRYMAYGIVATFQITLVLIFKLLFFNMIYS